MMKATVDGMRGVLASVVLVGWLAGCAVGPDFRPPEPPAASAYLPGGHPSETVAATGPGGATQRFEPGTDIPSEWWSLFRSETLDRRIRIALKESPTLAQARARLVQAREDRNARAGATRYPAVDAEVSAARRKVNPASLGVPNVPEPARSPCTTRRFPFRTRSTCSGGTAARSRASGPRSITGSSNWRRRGGRWPRTS